MATATTPPTEYETLYEAFQQEILEFYDLGFDVMGRWAEDRTKLALVSVRRDFERTDYHTFFDLNRLSNRFANVLLKLGLEKGDRKHGWDEKAGLPFRAVPVHRAASSDNGLGGPQSKTSVDQRITETIGVDLGDKYSAYCVLDHASGEEVESGRLRTTPAAFEKFSPRGPRLEP